MQRLRSARLALIWLSMKSLYFPCRTYTTTRALYCPSFTCLQQEILKELARESEPERVSLGMEVRTNGSEIGHMESPEADAAHRDRLMREIDDLFTRLPQPTDPMGAALAPTAEEQQENAAAEMLKEAVREAYWRKVDRQRAEERRVERAMERRFPSPSFQPSVAGDDATRGSAPTSGPSREELEKELLQLRCRVATLEAALEGKTSGRTSFE